MSATTWTCPEHGTQQGPGEACPSCLAEIRSAQPVAQMSPEQRAAELERWCGVLTVPFDLLHERIEQLVGRGVWTHELGWPDQLVAEIRRGEPASISDVLGKLPADKTVIVVHDEEAL